MSAIVTTDNRRKNLILYVAFLIFFATCLRITSSRNQIKSSINCSSFYATNSLECHPEAYSGAVVSPMQLGEVTSPYDKSLMEAANTVQPEEVPHEDFKAAQPQKEQNSPGPAQSSKRRSNKAAAIIETRMHVGMFAILLHFSAILGPDWPIILFTVPETYDGYAHSSSSVIKRLIKTGRLEIKLVPDGVTFPTTTMYSQYMCQKHMWEELAPAEHILIFQSDSMLCANSPLSVDDFLEYDFVGAPIPQPYGRGYNGGFSLRRRSSSLRVIERYDWNLYSKPAVEDQWFYERLLELQTEDINQNATSNITFPDLQTAKMFAVETQDYPTPVGVHQARRYPKQETLPLEQYCPEFKLSSGPWHI